MAGDDESGLPDYLVVGGGSAGCVVAARLSETLGPRHPAGSRPRGPRRLDQRPAGYARLFASGRYDWKFATEPEPELAAAPSPGRAAGCWAGRAR
jgi:choline dehydrogenase